jgi:hypothetical protein
MTLSNQTGGFGFNLDPLDDRHPLWLVIGAGPAEADQPD